MLKQKREILGKLANLRIKRIRELENLPLTEIFLDFSGHSGLGFV